MSLKTVIATSALLAAQLVAGHGAIIRATGNAGGEGMALGVDPNTPRDGTRRNPFQADSTRFKGAMAASVGETIGAGANDVKSGMQKILAMTGGSLPQVTPGGELTMTLHQVNADGAGPYTCMINTDGTAQTWTNIQVTQNVDGNQRGRNNAGSKADHVLKAAIPANTQCTGADADANMQNLCMVRCQNPARAGPFGGVVPVQMAGAAGGAAGGAAPAAGASPAAGAAPAAGNAPAAAPSAAPAAAAAAAPAAGTAKGNGAKANGAKANGAKANGAKGNKDADAQANNKRDLSGGAFIGHIDEVTRLVTFSA